MNRKVEQTFISANQLKVIVEHNGFQGGDASHGGYVKITIKDVDCTTMSLNGNYCKDGESIEIGVYGSAERETLLEGLKMIVKELEDYKYFTQK